MTTRRQLIVVVVLIVVQQLSFAQQYLFDGQRITPEDGLANLMTTAVCKSERGFIWIGTQYGLNRYDGQNFKLYTKESHGLSNNQTIRHIAEDSFGRLWIFYGDRHLMQRRSVSVNALDLFDPITQRVQTFEEAFGEQAPFEVTDVYLPQIIDPNNQLWLATEDGHVYVYDGSFRTVFYQADALFSDITVGEDGRIWLGHDEQLLCINAQGEVLEKVQLPASAAGVWTAAEGRVWVATFAPGQRQFRLWQVQENGQLEPFQLSQNGQPIDLWDPNPFARYYFFLHRTAEGFWFKAIDEELHVFDADGSWLYNFDAKLQADVPLYFFSYLEDEEALWLNTQVGVVRVKARPNPFQLIHRREGRLSDCRGIVEGDDGSIYFINGRLYRWNPQTQKVEVLLAKESPTYALANLDSMLWMGSYADYALILEWSNQQPAKVRHYPVLDNPWRGRAFTVLPMSGSNQVLVGTGSGLVQLDVQQKEAVPFASKASLEPIWDTLQRSFVNHLYRNEAGIWIGTESGIFLWEKDADRITFFNQQNGHLPYNRIRHMYEDEAGLFWLATVGGGIIRWQPGLDGEKSSWVQLTEADGLSNNYTYAIYEDQHGYLWISSDLGIMQLRKSDFQVKTYFTDDGLQHNEFNHTAHYQAKDGTLYFGGLGGLIRFHPDDFVEEKVNQSPMEFIGYYALEGNARQLTDRTSLLATTQEINIQPTDKLFELHFMLLDFEEAKKHRYAYKIEGYSDYWQPIRENYVRITNLPYGKYTLRIKGQNSSRGWSEQELALQINMLKPYYLEGWFIAIVLALLGALTALTVRWRIIQLKKDKIHLEAEVQKRTRQIDKDKETIAAQARALQKLDEVKTRFFANVTHEFRTPLTLIIGPIEQLLAKANSSTRQQKLDGVLKNAQHLRILINQLLDISKIESGQMRPEASLGDLVGYTEELVYLLHPLAEKKQVLLQMESSRGMWKVHFDKDKWSKIVYNLLTNAIKFTPEGGKVRLHLQDTAGGIRLQVSDTGIGIKAEELPHIFDRFYQTDSSLTRKQSGTGIGLALVKELVELQDGTIQVDSKPGAGTTFDVWLPELDADETALATEGKLDLPNLATAITADTNKPITPEDMANENQRLEVLLIEDNADMRAYIRSCLDASRYHFLEAGDGVDGLRMARDKVPDLIISDVMMPRKNGFEVVQAIREDLRTSHIPLVLLTAKASLESRLQGLARGADAYLTKPFSPQELELRVQKLIELRQSLQARYQGNQAPVDDPVYQKEDTFITELNAFIRENISNPDLNVEMLSKHFGISRTQFYRKLDALIGQSVAEYIRSIRLKEATELLRKGELTITEIAYAIGFSSPSHFSRTFKKAYGKPPSQLL